MTEKKFPFKFKNPDHYETHIYADDQYNQFAEDKEYILIIRDILEDWFLAMEDGTVNQRQPDPLYKAKITQEIADDVIDGLDREFSNELTWASNSGAGGFTSGPEFFRLESPQRIALCQAIHLVLEKDRKDYPERPHRLIVSSDDDIPGAQC